jgi:uncharacterized spore protein YtfJ
VEEEVVAGAEVVVEVVASKGFTEGRDKGREGKGGGGGGGGVYFTPIAAARIAPLAS